MKVAGMRSKGYMGHMVQIAITEIKPGYLAKRWILIRIQCTKLRPRVSRARDFGLRS
jgi:hypothetical protein